MNHPIDHIRKHIDLTPELEASLRSLMQERSYRRGDTIQFTSLLRGNAFYIQQGSARVFYIQGGKEHTFSFAFANQFVTLSMFLMDNPDSQLTIEFLEPTVVIFVPITDVRSILAEYTTHNMAEMATFIITALLENQRSLEERTLMYQSYSAEKRYHWLIERYPHILEHATITQIASFLGVTKETLYRIRSGKYNAN